MTLEETIERFKEQAATLRMARDYGCDECAAEYEQVAEWLAELQQRREADITAPPKTNADRIRKMTDEELAEFILNETNRVFQCNHCSYTGRICDKRMKCKKQIIEWLKQEVSEDAGTD